MDMARMDMILSKVFTGHVNHRLATYFEHISMNCIIGLKFNVVLFNLDSTSHKIQIQMLDREIEQRLVSVPKVKMLRNHIVYEIKCEGNLLERRRVRERVLDTGFRLVIATLPC